MQPIVRRQRAARKAAVQRVDWQIGQWNMSMVGASKPPSSCQSAARQATAEHTCWMTQQHNISTVHTFDTVHASIACQWRQTQAFLAYTGRAARSTKTSTVVSGCSGGRAYMRSLLFGADLVLSTRLVDCPQQSSKAENSALTPHPLFEQLSHSLVTPYSSCVA